jgi:2,4-dienoyl-CoA reductase-like NADH-dependent reductase (Old Yellow Enzyme family)
VGGAGLVIVEATAVSPEGRISPADSGIYLDEHVEPFARIVRFLKQQGSVAGIQLAHAGRKASASKPWEGDKHIDEPEGGWPTIAPSAVAFGDRLTGAGFEWLELQFAHGYLAHEFYSPLANHRTDQYGGSYENHIGPITRRSRCRIATQKKRTSAESVFSRDPAS